MRREKRFGGGEGESVHLSMGRGSRWEKLPGVSREDTDASSWITGYVERLDVLASQRL